MSNTLPMEMPTGTYDMIAHTLVERLEEYQIPEEERQENERALASARKEDEKKRDSAISEALNTYKRKNGLVKRTLSRIINGPYYPEITIEQSEQTKLFEQLVQFQDAYHRSLEVLTALLPEIYRKMQVNYTRLHERRETLKERTESTERTMQNFPEIEETYASLEDGLLTYEHLSKEEQEKLKTEIREMTGIDEQPSLDSEGVRELYVRSVANHRSNLSEDALEFRLDLWNQELSSVERQLDLLVEQGQQMEEGWKPAIRQLSRRHEQYTLLNRFAPAAHVILGMTELRTDTAELIEISDEVIEGVREYIADKLRVARALEEDIPEVINGE